MFEIESFWSLTFIWQDSISLPGLVGFTGPTSCLTLLLVHEDSQGFFLWLAKIHSRGWPESSFQLKSLSELDISSIQKNLNSTQRLGEGKYIKATLHPSKILVSTNTRSQSTKLSHDLRLFILSQLRAWHSLSWGNEKTHTFRFHHVPLTKKTCTNSGHVATCPVSGSMLVNAWNLGWWVQWSRPMDLLPVLPHQQQTLPFCLHPNFMS